MKRIYIGSWSTSTEPACWAATVAQDGQTSRVRLPHFTFHCHHIILTDKREGRGERGAFRVLNSTMWTFNAVFGAIIFMFVSNSLIMPHKGTVKSRTVCACVWVSVCVCVRVLYIRGPIKADKVVKVLALCCVVVWLMVCCGAVTHQAPLQRICFHYSLKCRCGNVKSGVKSRQA